MLVCALAEQNRKQDLICKWTTSDSHNAKLASFSDEHFDSLLGILNDSAMYGLFYRPRDIVFVVDEQGNVQPRELPDNDTCRCTLLAVSRSDLAAL